MSRAWTIGVPVMQWLTANRELHYRRRAEIVTTLRSGVVAACHRADLPKGITPVRLSAIAQYTGRSAPVRDRLNLAPTIKAVVDGLTPRVEKWRGGRAVVSLGYGLLPDDSDRHVLDTTWTLARLNADGPFEHGLPGYAGLVVLTITEVPDAHL